MAKNNDNRDSYESSDNGPREDFYASEVSRFETIMDRDLKEAFHRYGFTLYHSLPAARQVELSQKLGFVRNDATDYYNLGGVAIQREDYSGAIRHLNRALELDPKLSEATFNLALCYEKTNQKNEAVRQWKHYLEAVEDEDDKHAVEAHLQQLTA